MIAENENERGVASFKVLLQRFLEGLTEFTENLAWRTAFWQEIEPGI